MTFHGVHEELHEPSRDEDSRLPFALKFDIPTKFSFGAENVI